MFLSREENKQLTQYKYAIKQIEFLRKNGFKFEIDRYGHPILLRSYIENRMGGGNKGKSSQEPDSEALDKLLYAKTKRKR